MSNVDFLQHVQRPMDVHPTGPSTVETGESGPLKAIAPDSPRAAQAKIISAMGPQLADREIGLGSLISKEGAEVALNRASSSYVKSAVIGLLHSISTRLVSSGEHAQSKAVDLASKYHAMCGEGAGTEEKLAVLRDLKGQLEIAARDLPAHGSGEAIGHLIQFVEHEMAAVAGRNDLSREIEGFDPSTLRHVETSAKEPTLQEEVRSFDKSQLTHVEPGKTPTVLDEVRGFDKSQLKHVETSKTPTLQDEVRGFDKSQLKHAETSKTPTLQEEVRGFDKTNLKSTVTREMPASLKDLLVAAELEALWKKDANAALIVGRAIQADPRLAPFAAASDSDVGMARVAEKFVAFSKMDKAAADTLLATALKELSAGHSLDAVKTELDKKLIGAALAQDFKHIMAHSKAGLQDWNVAWNTKTSENAANLLIDGAGRVDRGLIAELKSQLASNMKRSTNPRGPHADHLNAILDKLVGSPGTELEFAL